MINLTAKSCIFVQNLNNTVGEPLVLHFIIICRVFRAAPASSPASPVAGSYAGFRRLLAYKVLQTASVSCRAAGSPFALFFGFKPNASWPRLRYLKVSCM